MADPRRVVVAMSGGVDSSVAAAMLRDEGFDVVGLFMRIGVEMPVPGPGCAVRPACCSVADADDARLVAGRLGIPFFAVNFKEEFDGIVDHFAAEYARGRTPNPCILCNERLKFGSLLRYARAIGAGSIATGHYARIERRGGRHALLKAVDRGKDQSYVLFGLAPELLAHVRFPVGILTKADVRRRAEKRALPVHDKPDSSDICFAPDRDYARVIRPLRPEAFRPGEVRDADGRVVGRHDGIGHYTIGQRRGLRIALGVPHYVTAIDPEANVVTIGPREDLLRRGLLASRVRWIVDEPQEPIRADVQIRYRHAAAPATVEPLCDGSVRVCFDVPQPAITPGQAAVFYREDEVLGGGWIDRSFG